MTIPDVPAGSMWRVTRIAVQAHHAQARSHAVVRCYTEPRISQWSFPNVREIQLEPDDVVTVGETLPADDALQYNVVTILTPKFCYVNKAYFNDALKLLERIA